MCKNVIYPREYHDFLKGPELILGMRWLRQLGLELIYLGADRMNDPVTTLVCKEFTYINMLFLRINHIQYTIGKDIEKQRSGYILRCMSDNRVCTRKQKFPELTKIEYAAQLIKAFVYSILGHNQIIKTEQKFLNHLLYNIIRNREITCDSLLKETIKLLERDDLGPLFTTVETICPKSTVLNEIRQKFGLTRGVRYSLEDEI